MPFRLSAPMVVVAKAAKKQKILQGGRNINKARFLKIPPEGGKTDKRREFPTEPGFRHSARGEGLWIDTQLNSAWVQTKLSSLQESKTYACQAHAEIGRVEGGSKYTRFSTLSKAWFGLIALLAVLASPWLNPRTILIDLASAGTRVSAEQRWHKYFKDRTEWWYDKNTSLSSKLHLKAPYVRDKEKALWIHERSTPNRVSQCGDRKTSKAPDGGSLISGSNLSGKSRTSNAVELKSHQQDTFLWTSHISKQMRCGQDRQALRIYYEMRESGVKPSSYTFVAALKACSSLQDLESTRQIHAEVIETGVWSVLHVGNMLVDVYAKCGSILDAKSVFETMPQRDVVSWNSMILGYVQMGFGDEALQLFAQMQQKGVIPDDRTYVGVLKACGSLATSEERSEGDRTTVRERCLEEVRAIHSQAMKTGSGLGVFIGTVLVDVYAKCGSLIDARLVFDNMVLRNVASWNAMILGCSQLGEGEGALQLYAQMQQEGVVPDDRTFLSALKACSSMLNLEGESGADVKRLQARCLMHVRAIHSDVMKKGTQSNVFVGTMLVDAYGKCGSLVDARHIFDKMPQRNVVSWNAMILGYAEKEEAKEALQLYNQMQQEGVVPNGRTFVSVLKAYSSLAVLEDGKEVDGTFVKQQCLGQVKSIHSLIVKSGSDADAFVETMLVDVYAKCGSLQNARHVFEKMQHRSVVPWNAMITGYALIREGEEALRLFIRMQQEGVVPDDRTFVGALKACISLAAMDKGNVTNDPLVQRHCLEQVRTIHSQLTKINSVAAVFVETMLLDAYARCGSLVDARQVFEEMLNRDVSSWNAIILGYAQVREGEEALKLYARMHMEGVVPDDRTYIAALKACSSAAELNKGKEIHELILKTRPEGTDAFVASSLIDMYGKCGSMLDAQRTFDALSTKDVVTWNALLAGYARQGESDIVFDLFERMSLEGIQPSHITFLSVLTLCSHVGLVDKGHRYFESMSKDYDISPTIDHYTCMVDLLGRAGHLEKAMEMVKIMPFTPHADVWKSILGACQKWNNVGLGRQAFDCAVWLDKHDAAAYVLMSNIYTAADMQEDADEIQARRIKARAWKKPGKCWWTDIGGVLHTFAVGP